MNNERTYFNPYVKSYPEPYGYELILDLHNCDSTLFYRGSITNFFQQLCHDINMEACDLHFWDDLHTPEDEKQTEPHTKGTSAVQFILTSSIVIHTLDDLGKVFINVFSCKEFDHDVVKELSTRWFSGTCVSQRFIKRM